MEDLKIKNPTETRKKIEEFYESKDSEWFELPPQPNWRQFKFRRFNKEGVIYWVKIRDRIDTKSKLRSHLLHHAPLDAYCTVSYWLNPTTLGKKDQGTDVLLGSDFVTDIDLKFIDNREETKKVANFLKEEGHKIDKIVFTGRGSHIHLYDFYQVKSNNLNKREDNCEKEMKKLANKLDEYEIDYEISVDVRRVRKVPNTITRYGNLAEEIKNIDSFEPKNIIEIKQKEYTKLVDL